MPFKSILEKFKIYYQNHPKRSKAALSLGVVVIALVSWALFAFAQSVVDSFNDSTKVAATWQTTVNTGVGTVTLQTKTCSTTQWFCSEATRCTNDLGDGSYILVSQGTTTTYSWKTSNTLCAQPQCLGLPSGYTILKADNTLDFSLYPARNYCKSIGGRLPTLVELQCIYTNLANFGNNFGTNRYWSSLEISGIDAEVVNFSTGGSSTYNKTNAISVRCVRGW